MCVDYPLLNYLWMRNNLYYIWNMFIYIIRYLGDEVISKDKRHLNFVYTLYITQNVILYNIFNNFVHETNFFILKDQKAKPCMWEIYGYLASPSLLTLNLYATNNYLFILIYTQVLNIEKIWYAIGIVKIYCTQGKWV
jgi:hypothetical protein